MAMLQGLSTEFDVSFQELLGFLLHSNISVILWTQKITLFLFRSQQKKDLEIKGKKKCLAL